jgi:hypothetical protein
VAQLELLEDVRDVRLDGRVADVELAADLRVREASRDQAEHAQLALRQLVEPSRGRGLLREGTLVFGAAPESDS